MLSIRWAQANVARPGSGSICALRHNAHVSSNHGWPAVCVWPAARLNVRGIHKQQRSVAAQFNAPICSSTSYKTSPTFTKSVCEAGPATRTELVMHGAAPHAPACASARVRAWPEIAHTRDRVCTAGNEGRDEKRAGLVGTKVDADAARRLRNWHLFHSIALVRILYVAALAAQKECAQAHASLPRGPSRCSPSPLGQHCAGCGRHRCLCGEGSNCTDRILKVKCLIY